MKTAFFLILISLAIHVQSQEIRNPVLTSLNLNLGYQIRLLSDAQKSALVYNSREYMAGVSLTKIGQRTLINIGLDVSMGDFRSRRFSDRWLFITTYDIHGNAEVDSFPVTSRIVSGKLQISYLRFLNQNKNMRWLAGVSLKEFLIYPENNIGLLNSLGLHMNFGIMQNLGHRGMIRSVISFPAVAINTRLPWHNTATAPIDNEMKTFFKKGSRLVSLNNFRMIEFNLDFDFRIAHRWTIGAGYAFTWIGVPYYQPLKSLTNSARVKTALIL